MESSRRILTLNLSQQQLWAKIFSGLSLSICKILRTLEVSFSQNMDPKKSVKRLLNWVTISIGSQLCELKPAVTHNVWVKNYEIVICSTVRLDSKVATVYCAHTNTLALYFTWIQVWTNDMFRFRGFQNGLKICSAKHFLDTYGNSL